MTSHELHCEVSETESQDTGRVYTVRLKGHLVSSTSATLRTTVKPLIDGGGTIHLNFADVDYVDSTGLGALVALKLSAIKQGYCSLHFDDLSARLQQLVSMTNLGELFSKH